MEILIFEGQLPPPAQSHSTMGASVVPRVSAALKHPTAQAGAITASRLMHRGEDILTSVSCPNPPHSTLRGSLGWCSSPAREGGRSCLPTGESLGSPRCRTSTRELPAKGFSHSQAGGN